MMTAPMFWPTRDAKHAGILDIGLLGGAIYDPDRFRYTSSSPLTQMLSRERPWEPRPPQGWAIMRRAAETKSVQLNSVHAEMSRGMSYLTANNPHEWFHDTAMQEGLAESAYEDFALSIYDPFQGNVCAASSFIGLPVIATPSGPTGSDLSIILVGHKPKQQPPFALIRPKSTLLPFLSPILQIATPPLSFKNGADEQILVRTREIVTIVAPQSGVPLTLARMQPEYIRTVGSISSRPANCRDHTIHATISPYIPNTYALVGDQGRVAIWTRQSSDNNASKGRQNIKDAVTIIRKRDDLSNDQKDPWRSCIWSAHPSNLIVASRTQMELVDYRGPTATTSLFELREGETFQALQENSVSSLTPFYTYVATSHQIACVDQRFPKRPLISTSHQMGRAMPCGLKTMDTTADGSRYTTVVTWDMRNAGITTYNFSHGSNTTEMKPPSMSGGAQELPSFHTHAHYTNTSELRNPLKRVNDTAALGDRMYQGIKPPLMGLAVLPSSILSYEDDDDSGQSQGSVSSESHNGGSSTIKFSVLQYAATGAVYAQEIEMIKRQESDHDASSDRILTSGNELAINIAQEHPGEVESEVDSEEDSRQWEMVEKIFKASQGWVAPWKKGVKEAQVAADEPAVPESNVREHVTVDVRKLMEGLRMYLLLDRETNESGINLESKVTEAMEFIGQSGASVTMYEVLHKIKCAHLPMTTRNALSQQIQNRIELDPLITSSNNRVIRQKIIRTWPNFDHDISSTIRGSEATVQAIQKYLERLYPLPKARALDLGSSQSQSAGHSRSSQAMDTSESESINEGDDAHVWPSQESRQIRATTIRRMAQELALTTTVIVKTTEPDVLEEEPETASSTSTSTRPPFAFKYLFQDTKDRSFKPPRIILSSRAQGVLDEWYTGDITQEFTYRDLSLTEEEAALETDEAKQAQAEALLKKRARREKKENKIRSTRMQDSSYNINAKGSASQPAGIITEEIPLFSQMGYADEDGMFSAPTIVAASQLRRENLKTRSQQHSVRTTTAIRNPFSFSQPASIAGGVSSTKSGSSSGHPKLKGELSPVESKSQPAEFFSPARKREISGGDRKPSNSQETDVVESQGSSQDSTLKPETQSPLPLPSQEPLLIAAASQPVPGPFATKRTMIQGSKAVNPSSKPKKKKIRTQGF
ncbi:TATA box-binding protein-associated factor RNA polymerase I subunit C [Linnemannia schmuckeri]|uniref:TATA box-binding protein-associated factor RNA polymerase I subunit C n=1 Tax=Linnemannia schmuckeri TaxID=64567 RepID=A0A9P5S0E5_9FUNG|nr:TATA box-binding protein-associated factor RNA polymerase I subunit C [Linnemannia schmuckeri]